MPEEPKEIEVEVVEIDGVAPVVRQPSADEPARRAEEWRDWRQWQGRVRRLDSRWWPLWVILGIIALALALTVGLVAGVILLIVRLFLNLIRAVLR
ncbi:MAG: hypothetical protein MUF86_02635 [Akkermansiaceae bacterium]|jgi:hypothetical protein|nr:hypothetical protein [Akkermansiaceae bacterium]MCU0776543.1 hypothetical protein [Akkermansiaceae bacterium]